MIENENENYLLNDLILLKGHGEYLNESEELQNSEHKIYFRFSYLIPDNEKLFQENKEIIWKWLKIFVVMIKNINMLSK
jgi:hypothetical protein